MRQATGCAGRKELDVGDAGIDGAHDLRGCDHAREHRHAAREAARHDRVPKAGHHDELGSRVDGSVRLIHGQHGAGPDQQVRLGRSHQRDGLDAGRGPEGDLGARQASVTQRDTQRRSVLGAPDGHHRHDTAFADTITNVQRPIPAPARRPGRAASARRMHAPGHPMFTGYRTPPPFCRWPLQQESGGVLPCRGDRVTPRTSLGDARSPRVRRWCASAATVVLLTSMMAAVGQPVVHAQGPCVPETEPNDTPEGALTTSGPLCSSGSLPDGDQDLLIWEVSAADADKRWTVSLTGLPDTTTSLTLLPIVSDAGVAPVVTGTAALALESDPTTIGAVAQSGLLVARRPIPPGGVAQSHRRW